jgi:hypothetical protein
MSEFAHFERRAAEIRKIADDIFDQRERAVLLEFVADLERRATKQANGGPTIPRTEIANDD